MDLCRLLCIAHVVRTTVLVMKKTEGNSYENFLKNYKILPSDSMGRGRWSIVVVNNVYELSYPPPKNNTVLKLSESRLKSSISISHQIKPGFL